MTSSSAQNPTITVQCRKGLQAEPSPRAFHVDDVIEMAERALPSRSPRLTLRKLFQRAFDLDDQAAEMLVIESVERRQLIKKVFTAPAKAGILKTTPPEAVWRKNAQEKSTR